MYFYFHHVCFINIKLSLPILIFKCTAPAPNIALNKPVTQSSHFYAVSQQVRLVDGILDSSNYAHTACDELSPWLEIDLQGEYYIDTIVIYNRISNDHKISGFKMQLLNKERVETESYDYSVWNNIQDTYVRLVSSRA
eukprot:Awhi_evm2s3415